MKKQFNPRLMLSLSMAIFGTLGLFTRYINVTSAELALYRAILASAMIAVYFIAAKQKIDLKSIGKELPLLAISGVAMGVNWILLFEAYKYTSISIATLSYYFAPVIVTVLSPLLFKERMTAKQVICFVMSTLGLVLIIGVGSNASTGTDIIGILFGIGAAVLYASVVLLNKFIKNVQGIHRTLLQFLAAITALLPYVLLTSGVTLSGLDTKGVICLLIVGLVHTGVTYCMYFSSLKDISGQKAAILSYIDPLVAVLVSVFILSEDISFWQIVGGVLILGFTLLNEITFKKKSDKQTSA